MARKKADTLRKKRQDGKDMAELLKRLPKEKHGDAYLLLEGFTVGCSKSEKKTG